jgi:HemX protein
MAVLLEVAPFLLLAAYLVVEVAYGALFFTGRRWAQWLAPMGLRATFALHLLYLAGLTHQHQQFPAATVSQALSVVALAITAIYIFLEWHGRERGTGFWLIAQVCVFQGLAVAFGGTPPPRVEVFEHPLFGAHVALALVGYAAFAVAASYGFLFLRLYRELKRGSFSHFYGKLPPLEVLERMMAGALAVGFVSLTGALLDGAVWALLLGSSRPLEGPMILLTLATWALYGFALILRRLHRWQGRQTALASLTGLGVILTSLLVVQLFYSGFHRLQ